MERVHLLKIQFQQMLPLFVNSSHHSDVLEELQILANRLTSANNSRPFRCANRRPVLFAQVFT